MALRKLEKETRISLRQKDSLLQWRNYPQWYMVWYPLESATTRSEEQARLSKHLCLFVNQIALTWSNRITFRFSIVKVTRQYVLIPLIPSGCWVVVRQLHTNIRHTSQDGGCWTGMGARIGRKHGPCHTPWLIESDIINNSTVVVDESPDTTCDIL
jgi:hypothetical protein